MELDKELELVKKNGNEIRHMIKPPFDVMMEAVKKTPSSSQHIQNPPVAVMVMK